MNTLENKVSALELRVEKLEGFLKASQELLNNYFSTEEPKYTGGWNEMLDQSLNGSPVTTELFIEELFIEESVVVSRGPLSEEHKEKIARSKHKKVRDRDTGVVYESCEAAAIAHDINVKTLSAWLVGRNPNKSSLYYTEYH